MCLTNVEKYYDKDDNKEGYGYKIVYKYNKNKFQFYFFHRPKKCSFNKWLKRGQVTAIATENRKQEYPSGFHVYTSKAAAKKAQLYTACTLVKVLYKGRVCKGKQYVAWSNETDCFVVKQIMVLDDKIE
jgi:hypothetical protein